MTSRGADHLDAPGIGEDPAEDSTDIYAFRSPENPENLVVALNVNPFSIPGSLERNFPKDMLYEIHVDNNGDIAADASVGITFSEPVPGRSQTFIVTGLASTPITGQTTAPTAGETPAPENIPQTGPIEIFAGPRDAPFFFDLFAFLGAYSCCAAPAGSPGGPPVARLYAPVATSSLV